MELRLKQQAAHSNNQLYMSTTKNAIHIKRVRVDREETASSATAGCVHDVCGQ